MSVAAAGQSPLVRTSLGELVYERLLGEILGNQLPSGAALNVADIARRLQVSPSPVRDALTRLSADGLVESVNHRRAAVVQFDRADVVATLELREILEAAAAERAADRIDEAGLVELESLIQRCAARHADPARKRETLELDHQFHLAVARHARNPRLLDEIVRTGRRSLVFQWVHLDLRSMGLAEREHRAILRALAARDAGAARRAMGEHIRAALAHLLRGLDGPA